MDSLNANQASRMHSVGGLATPRISYVKVLAGWVDRTGLGDTVLVAGSYEVTPPWRGVGGVDRSF